MAIDLLFAHATGESLSWLAARLRSHGFARVITASGGRSAIASLRQTQFNVLVTCVSLGDIDCWRLIRIIRSGRFGQADLPAVVLCEPRRARTLRTIADDHGAILAADEDPNRLKDDIRRAVAGRRTPSVLIIEDDASAADAARIALQKAYEVEICTDGEQGLEAWTARRHDLVLLDVMLPNLSGPAVLRRIVKEDPRQPVIILTAYATGERHEDLMVAGASEFLEKPVELTALREACARVLRHSEHLSASADAEEAHVALTHIARRVHLADYSLSRGQTGHASHHLRSALALCERGELSDDEWAHLLHEAD